MTPKRAALAASVCTVGIACLLLVLSWIAGGHIEEAAAPRLYIGALVVLLFAIPTGGFGLLLYGLYGLLYGAFRQRGPR